MFRLVNLNERVEVKQFIILTKVNHLAKSLSNDASLALLRLVNQSVGV